MNEILKKMLESQILTESVVQSIQEGFDQMLAEAVAEKEAEVKAQLAEQWVQEKEMLVEAIDLKLQELVESEVKDLKDEIKQFRDLEVEYAQKVASKEQELVETYKQDLTDLVKSIDSFMERRLVIELKEFADSLEQVKKNELGMKIYETFSGVFMDKFISEDATHARLAETEARLNEAKQQLETLNKRSEQLQRKTTMESLLGTIGNNEQREVMKTLLESVQTKDLETAFNRYIPVVIEKGTRKQTITESVKDAPQPKQKTVKEGVVVSGNVDQIVKQPTTNSLDESVRAQLRKLSGIID